MRSTSLLAAAVLMAVGLVSVQASPRVLLEETWGSDVGAWDMDLDTSPPDHHINSDADGDDGVLSHAATLGTHSGVLQINADTDGQFGVIRDYITDTGGAVHMAPNVNFQTLGGWGVDNISFDFHNDQVGPGAAALSLYFLSNDGGGNDVIWYYNFNPADLDPGWNDDLSVAMNWTGGGAGFGSWYTIYGVNTALGFAAALEDVDEIGILLTYQDNLDGQIYGLDNFQLNGTIPEPGTYGMIGFALVSVAATFRRKLNAAWAGVRSRA